MYFLVATLFECMESFLLRIFRICWVQFRSHDWSFESVFPELSGMRYTYKQNRESVFNEVAIPYRVMLHVKTCYVFVGSTTASAVFPSPSYGFLSLAHKTFFPLASCYLFTISSTSTWLVQIALIEYIVIRMFFLLTALISLCCGLWSSLSLWTNFHIYNI